MSMTHFGDEMPCRRDLFASIWGMVGFSIETSKETYSYNFGFDAMSLYFNEREYFTSNIFSHGSSLTSCCYFISSDQALNQGFPSLHNFSNCTTRNPIHETSKVPAYFRRLSTVE